MATMSLAHLVFVAWAWHAYSVRRVAVHFAMRAARLLVQVWATRECTSLTAWGRQRVLLGSADPRRSLAAVLFVIPMMALWALVHPVPVVLQPPLCGAAVFIYVTRWLPRVAAAIAHPRVASASEALCGRLAVALLFVDTATTSVFG
jgi:hypothetical protein